MDYTQIPKSLIYKNRSIDEFLEENDLNEKLIDNMNNLDWLRMGDFESIASDCLNQAYYICMVMRLARKPSYKLSWFYDRAYCGHKNDDLYKLITMALVLILNDASNRKWLEKNHKMFEQIKKDLQYQCVVRNVVSEIGIPIPDTLSFETIYKTLYNGIKIRVYISEVVFVPRPILDGIRDTCILNDIIDGLSYILEEIRKLTDKDIRQQCVDELIPFKFGDPFPWEMRGAKNNIRVLCEELGLDIPEYALKNDDAAEHEALEDEDEIEYDEEDTEECDDNTLVDLQKRIKELTDENQQLKEEKEDMIIELLMPIFKDVEGENKEDNIRSFLKEIKGKDGTEVTDVVFEWAEKNKISKGQYKRPLWQVLHAARYYSKVEQNWSTALRTHPPIKPQSDKR